MESQAVSLLPVPGQSAELAQLVEQFIRNE